MILIKKWLLFFSVFLSIFSSSLQGNTTTATQASLISEETSIQPGRPFWVAVQLELPPHWHAYWKNPGDAGMPVQVEWDLPPNFTVGELEWPYPQKMEFSGIIGFGYENELILLAQVSPPTEMEPNEQQVQLGAKVRWLSCSDAECVPGSSKESLTLPVSNDVPAVNSATAPIFARARENLPQLPDAVVVFRENDSLKLSVSLPESIVAMGDRAPQLEFYPETKKLIDLRHEQATLSADGTVELPLKELKKSTSLKGVLLVKQGDLSRAYSIDAPIEKGESQEIAEVDRSAIVQTLPAVAVPAASEISGFWMAILFAFVGGMILNLMPCVLPVISFKVLSFVKMARESRATTMKHGLSFSLGVVVSFWVLAGLLLTLRAYGKAVGWGFQLQEPLFVGILAGVMFLLSLSLLGVFELGMSLSSWAGQVEHSTKKEAPEGLFTSFCSGVLATALATPCTGPFLGSAVGFAFTLPSYQAMLIFTSLGIGMASPYLLLGVFPGLLKFMPKPGAWMETFKQLMGFVVLASVLWLIWVFAAQTNELSLFFLLFSLYLLGIGSWVYGKWGTPANSTWARRTSLIVSLALLLGSFEIVNRASSFSIPMTEQNKEIADTWEPYSKARIEELRKAGVPVIVDFTAKWCLICQANHMVLSTDEVNEKFNQLGVVRMKADWTRNDPEITDALAEFGRNSVPLYLLYGSEADASPTILPQVLTPDVVLEELERLPVPVEESEAV